MLSDHLSAFPGGPGVKTSYSQCHGCGFNPRSGNYRYPMPCMHTAKKKKRIWVTQRTQGSVRPLRRASNPDWMLKFLEKETSKPGLKTWVRVLSTVSLKGLFK